MRLRYTLSALEDLDSILEYIGERSPEGAKRIRSRISAVADLLLQFPLSGTATENPSIRSKTTAPYPYVIFYQVTDDEIVIHAVRHGACAAYGFPGATPRGYLHEV
jgi:addiction module RelE/StbE family toxin